MKGNYRLSDVLMAISNYDGFEYSDKYDLLINVLNDVDLLNQIMKSKSRNNYIKTFQYNLLNHDHFVSKTNLEYSDDSID